MKLNLKWELLPFNVRIADTRIVVPRGIVKHIRRKIANMEFLVNLVVLAIKNAQMLLKRPWPRDAKVKHDWDRDRISLKNGKKKMYIEFGQKTKQKGFQSSCPCVLRPAIWQKF